MRERVEVPGFAPWTVKSGALHVSPPEDVLAAMVTLRVHLDQVGAENGPLLVAPGSHNFGRVDESTLESTVRQCGRYSCHASAGDIWAYATLILHASKASRSHGRRRVLQLDYASTDLPGGLKWLDLIETR